MIPRTRVKMCGITRPEDAILAARLGADAVGLVFCEDSPRFVTFSQAYEIAKAVLPFTTLVGVFANAEEAEVCSVINQARLDMLQFHGDESPEFCRGFGRPYLKTFRVGAMEDASCFAEKLSNFVRKYASAQGILLDTDSQRARGGTGQSFDWGVLSWPLPPCGGGLGWGVDERLPLEKPLILAGGLRPENVAEAIRIAQPHSVDVSSGIESAPGVKDAALMQRFMESVRLCQTTV